MPKLHRVQRIVLPILRDASLTANDGDDGPADPVTVTSWAPNIDYRTFPMINVRRLGGIRNPMRPTLLSTPVIEMTAYGGVNQQLEGTEQLYEDALETLYYAVKNQTQTEHGYLHSIFETMGATQFSSPFQDSWRVQGLIQLGVRPPRSA